MSTSSRGGTDPLVESQVDKIIPDLTDTQWIRLRDLIHQLTQEAYDKGCKDTQKVYQEIGQEARKFIDGKNTINKGDIDYSKMQKYIPTRCPKCKRIHQPEYRRCRGLRENITKEDK